MTFLHQQFISNSEEETIQVGKNIASQSFPGLLITLDGDLGTGKTTLVAAIAEGLGVPRTFIQSPTYVILRLYTEGAIPIFHWDFYRVTSLPELEVADFYHTLNERRGLVIIEWASRFREAWECFFPRYEIYITMRREDDVRYIDFMRRA